MRNLYNLYSVFLFCMITDIVHSQNLNSPKNVASQISDTRLYVPKIKNDSLGNISNTELNELKRRIKDLDTQLQNNLNSRNEVLNLRERIVVLEEIKESEKKIQKNIAIENYCSALTNLFYLNEEIKEVKIYNSTQAFYTTLNEVSNPMYYRDYQSWLIEYKAYLERNKNSDIILEMASDLVKSTANLSNNTFSLGGLGSIVFSSIEKFISSLGGNKNALKAQSIKMFKLMVFLDNFQRDKQLIKTEYDEIIQDLNIIEKIQSDITDEIVLTLGLTTSLKSKNFDLETDQSKRIAYLGRVKKIVVSKISLIDKEAVYSQKLSVQSLKIRYGNLKARLIENIDKYQELIEKYKNNEFVDFTNLETKYNSVVEQFGNKLDIEKYINDSVRMYNREY